MGVAKIFQNRSIIVDILAIFFGIGTWIGINGTFIQLPLLVEVAPEGWSLPSYLSVMVQIGNLGPLTYTLIQKFCKRNDAPMIYLLLATGTLSAILTAFFYNKTAVVFGGEHSVALFALTVFTAFTACTSSVLFMPYMGRFREIYLITYFVGEGLSGLLPSVVALIQGIGGSAECILVNQTESGEPIYEKYVPPPRFGTQDFFIFVFAMMLLSCAGFTLLDRLKLSRTQYAAVKVGQGNDYVYERETKATTSTVEANDNKSSGATTTAAAATNGVDNNQNTVVEELAPEISSRVYVFLLLLIGIISFFANGIFNSIQSYSCLPYGGQAYHLSATLSVIANPLACFLAIFLPHTSLRSILSLTGLASLLTIYVFVTAAMSPYPPLHGTTAGSVLVIIAWTLLIGLVSYIKLSITTVMRSQGGKSLVWTGGLTQLGSFIGSILIFILINYTNSFTAAYEEC
ncbi:solute carrier family 52, riboflavin transporter, member 3-A [Musca vetustissima]|uniref:solute carrier family 52, riboflavin transporter, member 3-A n=1 Tax=Musca vetustissima TaxID=27455 RepID=UPI002AB641AC|nr:solute carrier family 52, riboflavin transporter, member 3-A [Musca vetustissima]